MVLFLKCLYLELQTVRLNSHLNLFGWNYLLNLSFFFFFFIQHCCCVLMLKHKTWNSVNSPTLTPNCFKSWLIRFQIELLLGYFIDKQRRLLMKLLRISSQSKPFEYLSVNQKKLWILGVKFISLSRKIWRCFVLDFIAIQPIGICRQVYLFNVFDVRSDLLERRM